MNKPDETLGSGLAVQFRVRALQARFTQVILIFYALIGGFPLRMIPAFAHGFKSLSASHDIVVGKFDDIV